MLAELNGPVPGISLKIDLVVPVIIKDLPQAVYRPYRFDSLVGNTGEGFAVGIVPACPWHKGINQVFEMLVGQSQILPGVQIETSRIHMDMEPATVIHFCITDVKHPAYRFQLFQAILTHQYRADQLESIISLQAAVRHQLPMIPGRVIITLNGNMDAGLPQFACQSFHITVIGFNLNTELVGEGVIHQGGCCPVQQDSTFSFKHFLLNIIYKTIVAACHQIGNLPARQAQTEQLLNLARLGGTLF
jgi:hypothetical protein